MFGRRGFYNWTQKWKGFRQLRNRPLSTNNTSNTNNGGADKVSNSLTKNEDVYKELDNLTFTKAAKILFTHPPKNKKFGIDFHLVQLFFVCMPSLAVYLVAQYARYDMRKMEAEVEKKKKADEEAKAKEIELKSNEEKEEEEKGKSELLEVKVRLEKLEETIKSIVVESKKQSNDSIKKSNVEQTVTKDPSHEGKTSVSPSHEGKTSVSP